MSSDKNSSNLTASVRQRLLNISREKGEIFDLILVRYGIERLLYRLGKSSEAEYFVLKGAMLFVLWTGKSHRPTRDLDLLGYGDSSPARLVNLFRTLCELKVESDGLIFDVDSVTAKQIREDGVYDGQRILLMAYLGKVRIPIQIDIGFGDAVIPSPSKLDYPTILSFEAPRLHVYPREAVIAEKLHAMVILGIANSRMKDFYDIWTLIQLFDFDSTVLVEAIRQTFRRRQTPLPTKLPIALTSEFWDHVTKRQQWQAFMAKGIRETVDLGHVASEISFFIAPILKIAADQNPHLSSWQSGGPWQITNA